MSGLEVGEVVAERDVHLTRESLVRYAGASGDFNPIHYRDDVAESMGLPGVLAHGMLTMGLAVETLVGWLGDSGRIIEYGVRFSKPVIVDLVEGAIVHVVATVGAVDDDIARIDLKVTHDTVTHDTVTHDTVTHDTVTHGTVEHGEIAVLGRAQVRIRLV